MLKYIFRIMLIFSLAAIMGATGALASSISQSYKSSVPLEAGTVVSIDNSKNEVTPASTFTTNTLIGVVVSKQDTTFSLGDTDSSTLVARSGNVTTFVSDINGTIKAGDRITASPLAGVGMKATSAGRVIGTSGGAIVDGTPLQVKDKQGKEHMVSVGRISLTVEIGNYDPNVGATSSFLPAALRSLANGIAGKDVTAWRLIASLILISVGLIITITFIYSSIRNSLAAIGRNPLSAPSIYRDVTTLLVITFAILAVSLACAYGLLKL